MIDKLHGVDSIKNLQNTQKTQRAVKIKPEDSISLSPEAQKLSEVYIAMEAVKAAPDVRQEKIAEVAKKLENPAYMDKALDMTAEKILASFGI